MQQDQPKQIILPKKEANKNLLLKNKLASVSVDSLNINRYVSEEKFVYSESRYFNVNQTPIIRGLKLGWLTLYNFDGTAAYSECTYDNSIGVLFELIMEGSSKRVTPAQARPNCIDYKNPREVELKPFDKAMIIYLSDLDRDNKKLYITARPWNIAKRDKVDEPLLSSLSYMIYSNSNIDNPDRVYQGLTIELTKLMVEKWFKEILLQYPENFVWDIKNSIECALKSL